MVDDQEQAQEPAQESEWARTLREERAAIAAAARERYAEEYEAHVARLLPLARAFGAALKEHRAAVAEVTSAVGTFPPPEEPYPAMARAARSLPDAIARVHRNARSQLRGSCVDAMAASTFRPAWLAGFGGGR